MNCTALRRARITARRKSPFFSAISTVVTPTTLSSGGSTSLATTTARYLCLTFDHSGSVIGGDVDLARVERGDAFAEAARLHELGVGFGVARLACSSMRASAWLVERGLV